MEIIYLTLEQQVCSARVFLNTFGLILEQPSQIDEYTFSIKIFNNNSEEVGMLYFENGKVNMVADSNFGKLKASYDLASYHGFKDIECGGAYCDWNQIINFNVTSKNQLNFSGNMQIGCSIDTEFGIKCRTHTLLEYKQNEKDVAINFMLNGTAFRYIISDSNEREIIDIRPCDAYNGFIIHRIDKDKYSDYSYFYSKYAGVHKKSSNEKNILRTLSFIEKNDEMLSYENNYIAMNGINESPESVIQKGILMQQIDSDYVKKIEEIKNLFVSDDVSLLDNFIDISFASYSDSEVKALFGLDRKKVKYQNGANNLVDAYYGIGKDNKFLSTEAQKRLLKNKEC